MKHTFKTNINCGGCVSAVTPILSKLENVGEWSVDTDHPDKLLTVSTEVASTVIEEAISEAGFNINLVESVA